MSVLSFLAILSKGGGGRVGQDRTTGAHVARAMGGDGMVFAAMVWFWKNGGTVVS